MNGNERFEVGKVRRKVGEFLWDDIKQPMLEVGWYVDWDCDLFFLYGFEVRTIYFAADASSRVIGVYGRVQRFAFQYLLWKRTYIHSLLGGLYPICHK